MIELWHGGSRWQGAPEVRPPKQGSYECGPGLYLTTNYLRARKYASGGKVTTKVVLKDGVKWLEDAKLPLRELVDYVKTAPRLIGRAQLLADLTRPHGGANASLDDPSPVYRLVNLMVNGNALAGKPGVHLAAWLASKGIEASLHRPMGGEQWVIVFDPKIITSYRVVPASDVSLDEYELPNIEMPRKAEKDQTP